ncbi:MAG: hypothetical protein COA62_08525 [Rhodobiaceae bacterium]|nr:MAG: hypothetical protein COA62_08525 [Rhodobiaceae bacterium]
MSDQASQNLVGRETLASTQITAAQSAGLDDTSTMGPWRRRSRAFLENRRAFISLLLFSLLAGMAFFAPVIANSDPLIVVYEGEVHFPFLRAPSERELGGPLPIRADFSDPELRENITEQGWIIWPPVRYAYDTVDFRTWGRHPAAPTRLHPFGTDDQARDVFARVLYGMRISLWFGLALTVISVSLGVLAGTVQGYFGGLLDLSFQRFIEIWESMPQLYILIIVSSFLVPNFLSLLVLLSLFSWVAVVGVVRAEVLRVRRLDYVSAARAMGVSSGVIMWRHVVPNALVAAMTMLPFVLTGSIVSLTSLDFLGFGLPTNSPSLGELLQQGRNNLNAPWLGFAAFGSLTLLLTLLVFVGEGVRDAFDPRRGRTPVRPKSSRMVKFSPISSATGRADALLIVRGLTINSSTDKAEKLVDSIQFEIGRNEIVGLVGESGSGKSLTARSLLDVLPHGVELQTNGQMMFDGVSIQFGSKDHARLRGVKIGFVPQEPMSALNPVHTVRRQIVEALSVGNEGSPASVLDGRLDELLNMVGLDQMKGRLNVYPHQLSGGERQRAVIAIAVANRPCLLVADEPTTALDVALQGQILDLFANLRRELGIAILLVSHDLPVVASLADRIMVMEGGQIVEQGPAKEIVSSPKSDQAKSLTKHMVPRQRDRTRPKTKDQGLLLEVKELTVGFATPSDHWWSAGAEFLAVNNSAFSLQSGETLGLVGASGSGKSTLGRAVLNMLPHRGEVNFLGSATKAERCPAQIVFQDPFSSLSPRLTVENIVAEPLGVHFPEMKADERAKRVQEILVRVGLGADVAHRYPHEFSGGQRQRVAIARALIVNPQLVVLDEPTSALDAAVQASILDLLASLQDDTGVAYLLITHDFSVLSAMADRIAVMSEGRIVEIGDREAVLNSPSHTYTKTLLNAARRLNPAGFDEPSSTLRPHEGV